MTLAPPGAPVPPPSSRPSPPQRRGASGPPLTGPGLCVGAGEGRWRGSTRGDPPLAGQPPRHPRAALDGHVPADISVLERPTLPWPPQTLSTKPCAPRPVTPAAPRAPAFFSLGQSWSSASSQLEGRMGLPAAPLLTVGPCGCAPPWWPPPAVTLEAPPGRQWTQRGSRDTPFPPNPRCSAFACDLVDSAGGCPRVFGCEAGVLRHTGGSGSASCQVLGSVGRAAAPHPAAPPSS